MRRRRRVGRRRRGLGLPWTWARRRPPVWGGESWSQVVRRSASAKPKLTAAKGSAASKASAETKGPAKGKPAGKGSAEGRGPPPYRPAKGGSAVQSARRPAPPAGPPLRTASAAASGGPPTDRRRPPTRGPPTAVHVEPMHTASLDDLFRQTPLPQEEKEALYWESVEGIAQDRRGRMPGYKLWLGDLSEHCTDLPLRRFLATRVRAGHCIDCNVQCRSTSGQRYAVLTYATREEAERVGWHLLEAATVHRSGNVVPMRVERYPRLH